MRFEGTLTEWNYERGFGAIAPSQGGQNLFVHVSAFPSAGEPPSLGELLSFELALDARGHKRVMHVQRCTPARSHAPSGAQAPQMQAFMMPTPRRGRFIAKSGARWRLGLAVAGVLGAVVAAVIWFIGARPHEGDANGAQARYAGASLAKDSGTHAPGKHTRRQ
ncbi:cold-shock protein [Roseateles koreensis]|uniref:Cold shock domain-containing protein n=1 Tax=Roseateles koreensis TaxID=2987526 RepID=A0ABT5KR86_9BURK|nr:cold shock domain-containing protein [Roseateles koreensis]MDC8785424.1 cold shock domain-containing protein [Roseateles koreensis]